MANIHTIFDSHKGKKKTIARNRKARSAKNNLLPSNIATLASSARPSKVRKTPAKKQGSNIHGLNSIQDAQVYWGQTNASDDEDKDATFVDDSDADSDTILIVLENHEKTTQDIVRDGETIRIVGGRSITDEQLLDEIRKDMRFQSFMPSREKRADGLIDRLGRDALAHARDKHDFVINWDNDDPGVSYAMATSNGGSGRGFRFSKGIFSDGVDDYQIARRRIRVTRTEVVSLDGKVITKNEEFTGVKVFSDGSIAVKPCNTRKDIGLRSNKRKGE